MCGIAGILNLSDEPVDPQTLLAMVDSMMLRGPDGRGLHTDANFGFGMRRLSIVDLEGGWQPIFNENRSLAIVMNGEIYNHIELRASLLKKGHRFNTNSDVEVLLHLYEDHGPKAVEFLNGMFAFAIWDTKNRKVLLGRDRLGIKPLIYSTQNRRFLFASTIDAIREGYQGTKPELDEDSLLFYFGLSYIPSPKTIYASIHKLPPGHLLEVHQNGTTKLTSYWKLQQFSSRTESYKSLLEEAKALFQNAVKLCLRSDVPVGTSLSGGIDSGGVTALGALAFKSDPSPGELHTFSIDFEGKKDEELYFASLVAKQSNTTHHPSILSLRESRDLHDELIPYLDEPIADSAVISSYFVAKAARASNVKVLLNGAGGDELFGGYHRHYPRPKDLLGKISFHPWLGHLLRALPLSVGERCFNHLEKNVAFGLSTSGVSLSTWFYSMKRPSFLRLLALLNEHFSDFRSYEKEFGPVLAPMYLDLTHYLPDNILALLDKTTMAASVEGRVPFLDHRLVELVFAIGKAQNFSKEKPKAFLRDILKDILPPQIMNRKKTGFNGPVNQWVQNTPLENAGNFPPEMKSIINGIFEPKKLDLDLSDSGTLPYNRENTYQIKFLNQWMKSHGGFLI